LRRNIPRLVIDLLEFPDDEDGNARARALMEKELDPLVIRA
jgi:hypothetical protein